MNEPPTERLLTLCYRPITVPAFTYQLTANYLWFPPQTFTSSPLLRPATTSSSTSLQPANQVASCFPSWSNHSTRQHSLFMLWDGGTLRVPCPNKSCTVVPSLLRPSNTAVPTATFTRQSREGDGSADPFPYRADTPPFRRLLKSSAGTDLFH
ncbi:hypothetical protein TNCV_1201191 [Trichonephila clavipes]|nr:hypothetical protein TNCV_1201191 [Trichonephila clavipes]